MHAGRPLSEGAGFCCPNPSASLRPAVLSHNGALGHLYVCFCLPEPGLSLGAPLASRCSGVCSTSVPEGFTPEGSQVSQDKDIPAINQGESTGPYSKSHAECGHAGKIERKFPPHMQGNKCKIHEEMLKSGFLYSFAG